ncbi:aldehyde dehydrogenase family protein [Alicyclobacillus fastidiosus]|uniref:Aldehyde dehydrogenase family protein n=1 Tax=Alicyclobacillus fastidiosus TaxID=392011 RepID=A0ABY6ZK41_9BACL|nr:aldehyde dehydrogenase family protein [Alicyclobacillus fastidiosus]WAH42546.1 aldehyde dehydrogenase family protein [Alicyclobacillus fastidiosus]GMA64393.1 hypothetical protein GCM10025859_48330 [Alicyclobacillus fastidiosus]
MGLDFSLLHQQYIDGEWRDGQSGRAYRDENPYDGSTVALFQTASKDDVDLAYLAAQRAQAVAHQGQICMCTNRVIVHRSVYEQFVDKLVTKVSSLKCGSPHEHDTVIGPLINHRQVELLLQTVDESVAQGAVIAYRGAVEGNVVGPIVLTDVAPSMACARKEMFGPAIAVIPVESEDEAVRVANDSDFGLSGAVHTRSLERGVEIAKRIESGMVHVNDGTVNDEPLVAFGGEKASGVGRYNGDWALDEFTTFKWISIQHEKRDYPF